MFVLRLIVILRQQFIDDIINIKDFDPSLLQINKKVIEKHWYLLYWIYHNETF